MSNLQNEKMKKKLYNTPQLNIVKINISNLLNTISANIRTEVVIDDPDEFGSRRNRNSVWDDEDEDENYDY